LLQFSITQPLKQTFNPSERSSKNVTSQIHLPQSVTEKALTEILLPVCLSSFAVFKRVRSMLATSEAYWCAESMGSDGCNEAKSHPFAK